ncbi:MAG TPA: 30S ribosomal protein S20 [Thermomicrobiales bacterium]|nr:30S ribosomal protein S20 [Thermomicrobiales bacterium]
MLRAATFVARWRSRLARPGPGLLRERTLPHRPRRQPQRGLGAWYYPASVAPPARIVLCPISLAHEGRIGLANSKSAEKRIRVAERRRMRNKPLRTQTRTYVKKAEAAIATDDQAAAAAEVLAAIRKLDSVASKGVIHKNNAARRKSRLMAKYNAMLAQANA